MKSITSCREAESKFCTPNGGVCTSKTIGLLARRHIVAGEFHYIDKEASTRWAGGPDPSMLADAGAMDSADETCREYERFADRRTLLRGATSDEHGAALVHSKQETKVV
jgi:hypothetical protein